MEVGQSMNLKCGVGVLLRGSRQLGEAFPNVSPSIVKEQCHSKCQSREEIDSDTNRAKMLV
eukprot:665519-Amphidinium_carterae.1